MRSVNSLIGLAIYPGKFTTKLKATRNKNDTMSATHHVALFAVDLATTFLCSIPNIFNCIIPKSNWRTWTRKTVCFSGLSPKSFNCSYFERSESVSRCSPGSVLLCSCLTRLLSISPICDGLSDDWFLSNALPMFLTNFTQLKIQLETILVLIFQIFLISWMDHLEEPNIKLK